MLVNKFFVWAEHAPGHDPNGKGQWYARPRHGKFIARIGALMMYRNGDSPKVHFLNMDDVAKDVFSSDFEMYDSFDEYSQRMEYWR